MANASDDDELDLVDQTEIAGRAKVTTGAVSMWLLRHGVGTKVPFPSPYKTLTIGQVWLWDDVLAWLTQTGRWPPLE